MPRLLLRATGKRVSKYGCKAGRREIAPGKEKKKKKEEGEAENGRVGMGIFPDLAGEGALPVN